MSGRPPVRGKKRSSSAPPQRPGDAGSSSDPPDQPVAGGEPAILEGDLMELPAGKSYDSCNENDGPTGDVLEEEELVGVEEHCTSAAEQPRTGSPTRASTVATNSKEKTKQLTAAQQAHAADQVKWQELKTDGSETRRFERPAFLPFKEGLGPTGFVAGPQHEKGGPRPELRAKLTHKTHPAIYVAHMGFDRALFEQFQSATNEYASAKGAGSEDFWKEYRPFSLGETMCGCGLLLRNGVSPVPQMTLQFKDPRDSFVFGDARVKEVWPGTNCGGSERRWVQWCSFFSHSIALSVLLEASSARAARPRQRRKA